MPITDGTTSGIVGFSAQTKVITSGGKNGNPTLPPNVFTVVDNYLAPSFNLGGGTFSNSGIYTVPETGVYVVSAFMVSDPLDDGVKGITSLFVNNQRDVALGRGVMGGSDVAGFGGTMVAQYSAGTQLSVAFYTTQTGGIKMREGGFFAALKSNDGIHTHAAQHPTIIRHNTDPSVPRPAAAASVRWIGTVRPVNAIFGDDWVGPV